MFQYKFLILLIFVLALLIGCATPTPYGPADKDWRGGYRDTHIRDNIYFVEISCNSFTSATTAVQYLHRRAGELCKENGFCDYKLSQEIDKTTSHYTGYAGRNVNVSESLKPHRTSYVECIKKCPVNK